MDSRRAWCGRMLASLCAWPVLHARAAPPRIGVLSFGAPPGNNATDPNHAFRQGLVDAGWIEGQNLAIEWRYGFGDPAKLRAAVEDLVRLRVDIVLTGGPAALHAARQATASVPIIAVAGGDPVREGWARSLAQPGGNVTGFTVTFPELPAKKLELLREALPHATRVAVLLTSSEVPDLMETRERLAAAADSLRLTLQYVEVPEEGDVTVAIDIAYAGRAQAVTLLATNTPVAQRISLAQRALARRLPTISDFPHMAHAGMLLSYGPDLYDLGRRSAALVDKILRGARVGDVPIERPQKLSLVINQRTARTLGLTVPRALLMRADEVIE